MGRPVEAGNAAHIVPDETKVILRMTQMYIDGAGFLRIVQALNATARRDRRPAREPIFAIR